MTDRTRGLYDKFIVQRTDGKSEPGQKHHDCEYFVLDLTHDKHAAAALRAYADSCAEEYPMLAKGIRDKWLTLECDTCSGSGTESHGETCISCGGTGMVDENGFMVTDQPPPPGNHT